MFSKIQYYSIYTMRRERAQVLQEEAEGAVVV